MTTTHSSLSKEDFSEYIKALKDYKKTGYKQSISIIQTLKVADLTQSQIEAFHPGAWSQFIQKLNPENDEEREIKEAVSDLVDKLHARYKDMKCTLLQVSGLDKMKKRSIEKSMRDDSDIKENLPINYSESKDEENLSGKQKYQEEEGDLLKKHEQRPLHEQRHSHRHHDEEENTPNLDQFVKDFAVQDLSEELVSDFKSNKQEKAKVLPLAREKAVELEKAIEQECQGDEEKFRLEARNVSAFLSIKPNERLRKGLLSGKIDPQEFVIHKEEYLNPELKMNVDEKEREAFNDGNLDRDIEIVPDSELYKCENCGSRKIEKTEKQMKLGDQSSTSVLFCAECDHVQMING